MRNRTEIKDGHEYRGFLVKLYPTAEQEIALRGLEAQSRMAWNFLVGFETRRKRTAEEIAVSEGIVGPRLERPDYKGMEPSEAKVAKEAHQTACRERSKKLWQGLKGRDVCKRTKAWAVAKEKGAKHDYQPVLEYVRAAQQECDVWPVKANANFYQAICKNFDSAKHLPNFRKRTDPSPIMWRSGECLMLGDFGNRRERTFYDCRVAANGLQIRGRLPGKKPGGRVVQGVAISRKADGWWAAFKVETPKKELPAFKPGSVVGIDVGLIDLAALSTGDVFANPRDVAFSERIAGRQATAARIADRDARGAYERTTWRLQLRAARSVRQKLYEIVRDVGAFETIAVERLPKDIGQRGSQRVSVMRTLIALLKERYGERVREVEPHYTSQDCSQCGERSKESWSCDRGRVGKCPFCGYSAHRDVNAARNVLKKYLKSQTAQAA